MTIQINVAEEYIALVKNLLLLKIINFLVVFILFYFYYYLDKERMSRKKHSHLSKARTKKKGLPFENEKEPLMAIAPLYLSLSRKLETVCLKSLKRMHSF